mmetsp:Transcript_15051/g.38701  ORF Transcript_15051/g.38701 Transcript_15051/m.38701 type:complete len:241 (-) Transcript_15051:28-750(-)
MPGMAALLEEPPLTPPARLFRAGSAHRLSKMERAYMTGICMTMGMRRGKKFLQEVSTQGSMAFVTMITLPIFMDIFSRASTCSWSSFSGLWYFSSCGAGLKKLSAGRFSRIQFEGQRVSSQSKRMMVCSGLKYSDWLPVDTMDSIVWRIVGFRRFEVPSRELPLPPMRLAPTLRVTMGPCEPAAAASSLPFLSFSASAGGFGLAGAADREPHIASRRRILNTVEAVRRGRPRPVEEKVLK